MTSFGFSLIPSLGSFVGVRPALNLRAMQRIETLREQANLMRRLAESFDIPQIKEELQRLAERCDQLAAKVTREVAEQRSRPIADLAKSGSKETH